MALTATFSEVLEGMDFPASREDIIGYARSRGASDEMTDSLEQLPEGIYHSMAEVWDVLADIV